MATIKWLGGTSTASSTAANWKGGAIPTAGDVALFDNEGLADCAWTLTGGSPVTVDEIVIESTFDHQVILNAAPTIKGLFINGTLNAGSSGTINFKHGSAPNYFGTYKSYAERFILIGDNAAYVGSNTFSLVGSSSPITKFDDGQHPAVRIQSGNFAPDYETPTGTSKKASFTSMIIAGGAFAPESAFSDNDRLKIFDFTAFDATAINTVNFGLATVEFTGSSGGVVLPTHNATGYSSTFQAYYRKIVLKAATAGHKVLLADNTFVSVEEFEIQDGCVLKGPTTLTAQGSDVRSIVTPKIRGTWSYSQISPGIYRSPRHASGPIDLINGNVHITGKLNVDGSIDPTGLELDPVGSNPGGVAANTLWLNSGDSNKLYHGSSEVGGGGGGITALTGDVTASGSGSVAATLDIDGMNAGGEPVNADLLVMDDGANGTNRKITFTQVASWVENNVSVAHIRDARADGDIHPNEFPDKAVSFNFTDDITGSPNAWDSVITMKGWSDNYRAWQIYSSSASGSQSVDQVPLFFRSGEEDVQDGWGATKEILTFPGTAPRVDGAANQVLQTDGAGTLAWANVGPKVQMMKLTKTGTSDIDANLVYDISNNQASVIDIGSANWTEDTSGTSHPAIEVLPDFGIKFNTAGIYRIDTGFYFHSNSAVTGGITCLMRASTDAPDPSQTGYYPSSGAAIDKGFNRFDYYISGQNLSLDPDFNMIFNAAANDTIYLYAYVNGIGSAKWRVRGHASEPLSQITITRIGDAQT